MQATEAMNCARCASVSNTIQVADSCGHRICSILSAWVCRYRKRSIPISSDNVQLTLQKSVTFQSNSENNCKQLGGKYTSSLRLESLDQIYNFEFWFGSFGWFSLKSLLYHGEQKPVNNNRSRTSQLRIACLGTSLTCTYHFQVFEPPPRIPWHAAVHDCHFLWWWRIHLTSLVNSEFTSSPSWFKSCLVAGRNVWTVNGGEGNSLVDPEEPRGVDLLLIAIVTRVCWYVHVQTRVSNMLPGASFCVGGGRGSNESTCTHKNHHGYCH